MNWAEYLIPGWILVLMQAPYVAPVRRDDVDITVGRPLITLVGGKIAEKNDNKSDSSGEIKPVFESRLVNGNSSTGRDHDDDDDDNAVLKDNMSNNYDASSFVSTGGGNEEDGFKPDEEVLSPSGLTEKFYGLLENQEAKMSGFHAEKDPSGSEILTGPMEQAIANNNGTFVYQNKGQTAGSVSDEEHTALGREDKLMSARVRELLLNDPLAKVSYVLNEGRVNPHQVLQSHQNQETVSVNGDDTYSDFKKGETGNQTENDVDHKGLHEVNMTSKNSSNEPDSIIDSGSASWQDQNQVNPYFNKTHDSTKPTSYPSEMTPESLNHSVVSEEAGLLNASQVLISQLPNLVENVVEHLGEKGSKFVSVELAKHPVIKDVWANAIAQALIKESNTISQLELERKSENVSSIDYDSRRIAESLNSLSNLTKENVQALSKTKPSYENADSSVKGNAHAVEQRLKDAPSKKPSRGSADKKLMSNQINDPARAVEVMLALKTESKTKATNRTVGSPPLLNQAKEPDYAMPVGNRTLSPTIHQTPRVGYELTSNTPVLTRQDNLNITVHNVQDSAHAKEGGQLEIIKTPFHNVARENFNLQGNGNNQPYFVSKSAERLAGGHNMNASGQQVYGSKTILTPVVNGFISNKEITTQLEGRVNKEHLFDNKPILTPSKVSPTRWPGIREEQRIQSSLNLARPTKGAVSGALAGRVIDAPFLYSNFTSLDPDETKYLQLNLMNDPVAKEGFSDSDSPYASQQQLQDEDAQEASYLERQINDAGHIVGELLPSLNSTMSRDGNSEASYISGQILGDPFSKAELAESFAGNNNLINEENRANSQIMASVFNEGKVAPSSDQHGNSPFQHRPHSDPSYTSATEEAVNLGTRTSLYGSDLSYRDATKMRSDVGQMVLSPNTVSDISAMDLAPISHLEGFQDAFNLNKPKIFMYQPLDVGDDRTEYMTGGELANDEAQYIVNPLPTATVRPQKKQLIHKEKTKHGKKTHRKAATSSSSSSSLLRTLPRSKNLKLSSKHVAVKNKPTKSRDQPGTRESEISPTSVIFGLTANEMKELEKHLAHRPQSLGAIAENGSVQRGTAATKEYYNTKTNEEQEKSDATMKRLVDRILKQRKLSHKARETSRKAHAVSHKRTHRTLLPPRSFLTFHKHRKINHGLHNKRDLESWESSTDVLNSDLDQIRGLSPKAQEDISNVIMRDFEGQQRHVKGVESFPFDERDPAYSFERALYNQVLDKTVRHLKDFQKYSQGRPTMGIKDNKNIETRTNKLHEKREAPDGDQSKDTKLNIPVVKKGNTILNGDVIPLDDVKNDLAQGLLLDTLRKESEGDLQYVNAVQKHDINRMKNMFQSAGVEIGIKRNSQVNSKPGKEKHSKVNKLAKKRDINDWKTEFNDGTFRSPDFERQLSHALRQESEHDLNYVDALQDLDKQGFKTLRQPEDLIGSRRVISQSSLRQKAEHKSKDGNPRESLANSQEKLRIFMQNSKSNDKGDANEEHEGGGNEQWTASAIKGSVFRDLTPEGKVLSSDYRDLGTFGSDAQAQLASILRTANNGDQRDLKELEKMDSDDEKDVENLFKSSSDILKRSIEGKPVEKKEGTIETIADVSDPGSKEKEINIVVSGDEEERGWSAWSKCTKSCGNGSMKTRSLYCNKSSPFDAIVKCPGWNHQTVPCDVPKNCPVNGGFTQWTEWSACSESCGSKAVRMRMRLCTNPPPAFGGNDCAGWRFEVEYCKPKGCPHRPAEQNCSPKIGTSKRKLPLKCLYPGTGDVCVSGRNRICISALEASKNNKQIIFKTVSATPVIEEMSNRLPSTAPDTSSTARSIAGYSGLANIDQEMAHIPSLQSLLNMPQRGNIRQMPSAPSVFRFQQMPNLRQFTSAPQALDFQSRQLMSSMQFLKPGMGSMSQGDQQETYENGGKTIHVQGDNDIGFTPWSYWTHCSASCGHGIKTRSRSCISAFNAVGIDDSCSGPKVQTKRCRIRRCPVDGHFSPWSDWSECSKTCGSDSYQKRERTCTDPPPRYGGEECEGMSVERRHCLKPPCSPGQVAYNMSKMFLQQLKLKNGSSNSTDGFTEWGPWSQCSRTCGSNLLRVRKRSCFKQNNQSCSGSTSEVKPCSLPRCPEDFVADFRTEAGLTEMTTSNISVKNEFDWSPWSACTKTCGVGSYRTRERTCSLSIPEDFRKVCIGSDIQKVPCMVPFCPRVAPVIPSTNPQQGNVMKTVSTLFLKPANAPLVQPAYRLKSTNQSSVSAKSASQTSPSSPIPPSNSSALVKPPPSSGVSDVNYSDWSPWSKCSATCGHQAVTHRKRTCKLIGGKTCQGSNTQTKQCQFLRCPVHGGFSPWSQWSHCAATCGGALKRRQRSCSNPKPMFGGRHCLGERIQTRSCGTEACSVNGGLTGWTEWSTCSKTCNTNTVSIRERYCTNPPPQGKGKDCIGQRMQARACASSNCPVDGGLSEWSLWSGCRRCRRTQRKRYRSCTNPAPVNGGKPCTAPLVQVQRCPVRQCRSTLGFGQWSSYSPCSNSCDGGIKKRRRRCRRPYKGCYGPRIQRRRCNEHRCPDGNYLVRADPVELCGYNPCKVAKCVTHPAAMCVSRFNCNPIFFNREGRIIKSCKGNSVVLSVPPEQVCRFNPCEKSACFTSQAERCAVSYKCKPIFFGADGERLNCRGILTVGAMEACGFNPCFEKACKVDLTARCVSDSDCRPTFISKTQQILDECVESAEDSDSNEEQDDAAFNETDDEDKNTDTGKDDADVEDISKTDSDDNHDDDDENEDMDDDDDEKDTNRRHKKGKSHKKSKDEDGDDDDDDAKETDSDDDNDDNDRDSNNTRKKNTTPVVNLKDDSLHDGMVSGMGSEISFVSKHGPAKFYWLKGRDKGSKNHTEMLVIEATESKKSSVLFSPRPGRLKTKEKSKT